MPEPNAQLFRLLRIYCKAAAVAVAALGCLVLYGWAAHIPILMSVLPGLVTMKPNTALSLLLSAFSLWLLIPLPEQRSIARRQIGRFLALVVTVIAVITAIEYISGWNLRIDQLLFHEFAGTYATFSPGRMSPATCSAFITIGAALLLLDRKMRVSNAWSQGLTLWAVLMAVLAATGYAYHATVLARIFLYTQVALHTAVGLLLLSTAILFARPADGIARDLTSTGSGSVMARRLLPAILLIPILFGWISLHGQSEGFYGKEVRAAIYATSVVVVFAILVWINARKMNAEYDQRSRARSDLRELNTKLEDRIAERTMALEQQTLILAEQAALLDLPHDAIIVRDLEGYILFWSCGAERMYGWPANLAVGKLGLELLRIEFPVPAEEIKAQILQKGHWEGEAVHYTRNGVRLNIGARWTLQRDAAGSPARILIINSDISERKRAEEALFIEKERAQVTLNSIGDAVICTDVSGKVTFLNLVAEKMTGWSHSQALGRPMGEIFRLLNATTREVSPNPMELAILNNKTMNLPADCILIRRDGVETPVEDSVSPIHDRKGAVTGAVIVFRDVTAARALALQMAHSAQHDFLTGLSNRMLLNDRIGQSISIAPRHQKKVAVLFLDLDGFKQINDSLGHQIGDKLLQSIGKRLLDCVRVSDTVSRQGGDEFVVLLAEVACAEDAALTATRMLQAISEAHHIDQNALHVTTSIGISIYPDHGMDASTLIKNADTAMYQAKQNGRQGYRFFTPAMVSAALSDSTAGEISSIAAQTPAS